MTLTGPGGVGKTRLAIETAAQLLDSFPDGVWLVDLAVLDPPSGTDAVPAATEVAEVLCVSLDIRDDPAAGLLPKSRPTEVTDWLAGALRHKRMLLVLDNCEHVVEPVAMLVERLLRAAPGLRILTTSREPLALAGEVLWTVPPLELPDRSADAEPTALATAPYNCSSCERLRHPLGSPSTAKTPVRSRRSADGWTGSRSCWSWPPPASGHSASMN